MSTAEKPAPWWKSDKLINILVPAFIATHTLMMGLLVALLVYSLDRTDQQFAAIDARFTAQNARIDAIFLELADMREELADIKADVKINRDRLEVLISNYEDHIQEHANLSQ